MNVNTKISQCLISAIDLLYIKPLTKIIPRHTFRYGVCGAVNIFLLDSTFYYLIYHFIICKRNVDLGFVTLSPHVASLFMVFPITFLIGFWLNRYVAFNATNSQTPIQLFKYALSVCGSIVISYFSLKFLVEVCHIWATPAKTLSSLITTIYSYIAARYFTFK